jgi:hypothetical protein
MPARPLPRHHTASTAVSLRRWLCAWLALLTALQMIGSTLAGLHGTWHHHRPPSMQSIAPSTPVIRWRHGEPEALARADIHAQMHVAGEAHEHAVTDASVLPLGGDVASEAVAQLTAALAPGADLSLNPLDAAHHVRAVAATWAATSHTIAPPLKPPRG